MNREQEWRQAEAEVVRGDEGRHGNRHESQQNGAVGGEK